MWLPLGHGLAASDRSRSCCVVAEDTEEVNRERAESYLRLLASEAAERVRRDRIRRQSEAVGTYVGQSAQARSFYEDWGGLLTPEE